MDDDAKRVSDEFSELFHYTTVPAFKSICTSQIFRATHYKHLNDSSELLRFRLKVSEEFANSRGGIDTEIAQRVVSRLDGIHESLFGDGGFRDTFLCSFCAHAPNSYAARHGLLSQWRGYGTDGGVAIVLDTKVIEDRMGIEKCVFAHSINHIGDVKYDNDDGGIRKAFCDVFAHFPGILDALCSDQRSCYIKIFKHFIHGTTLVKHQAFSEENEIRIVVSPRLTRPDSIFYESAHDSKPVKEIRYRQRGDSEVRYIELFGGASLPIKRVIVGPSRVKNLNYQTIRDTVMGSGIVVVKSETPFLG